MNKSKTCGIYQIKCFANGRIYVGSSVNIEVRWRQHLYDLRRQKHPCHHLQNAWNKYGEIAFDYTVLEECARDKATLLGREQHYIDTLEPEFNVCPTAGSRLGSKYTLEQLAAAIERVRARAALITHCPEGHAYDDKNTYRGKDGTRICRECNRLRVEAINAAMTPEQRDAKSQKLKAKYESEGRTKRGIAKAGSPEHHAKLVANNRGRVYGEEARQNMSAAAKKAATPERMGKTWAGHRRYLETVGHHQTGKPRTEEVRQKIRNTILATVTHCKHGHPFDETNTRWVKGKRLCRACRKALKRKLYTNETPEQAERRRELKRQSYHRHGDANRERQNARYRQSVNAA